MSQFTVTDRAKADLRGIWAYVAQNNVDAADHLAATIVGKYRLLAKHPRLGPARDEFESGLRSFVVGSYLIFYRPTDEGIEVVRVLSGVRDLDALFGA